jgi:hypothetical protein
MTRGTFSHRTLVFAAVCLVAVFQSAAQGNAKPKHLKSDQLLLDAAAHNGFGEVAPWHVKASYELFDDHGKHKSAGTFEEWWFGPKSYKTVFTGDDLKQTDVATEAGLFRSGDQRWLSRQENLVPLLIASPLQVHPYDPRKNDLVDEVRAMGPSKLRCVFLLRKPALDEPAGANLGANLDLTPSYCFEPESSVLRYGSRGGGREVMLLNDIAQIAGRFVARNIHIMNGRADSLTISVTDAGLVAPNSPPPAAPEGSTGPLGGRVELPFDRLHQVGGQLDLQRSEMIELAGSDLAIKAVIGKDGHVLEATMVKGPAGLGNTVAKAARKLIFAPFTVLGEPVEVETTVTSQLDLSAASADAPARGRR